MINDFNLTKGFVFQIYQTAQGYFISSKESGRSGHGDCGGRQVLLSHAEAAALASGEIVTIREGAKTHQAIQTNLADVICGGTSLIINTSGREHSFRVILYNTLCFHSNP